MISLLRRRVGRTAAEAKATVDTASVKAQATALVEDLRQTIDKLHQVIDRMPEEEEADGG